MSVDSNTHMILNFIGKDIFLSESKSDVESKLSAYEQCISEIRERISLEGEVKVGSWWRGVE